MNGLKYMALTAAAAVGLVLAGPAAHTQVSFNARIGPAPVCPYGYFDFPPYDCAPYGYYGPAWFPNGAFVGAGPWFRGPPGFSARVNSRFSPRSGFRGPFPPRGSPSQFRTRSPRDFRGNMTIDGRGRRR